MSTLKTSTRPLRWLAFLGMLHGAAVAVGVPWAVFRYGGEAGLNIVAAAGLALVGIAGGVGTVFIATHLALTHARDIHAT